MNGHTTKEYGGHKYDDGDGTSDCQHGCGCWMGPARSGGPTGLDPSGTCPNNPKDGKLLGGNADYDSVVTERIQSLSSRLYKAEELLKRVSPSKSQLAEKLAKTKAELTRLTDVMEDIRQLTAAIR